GVTCPCCGTIMTMDDVQLEGRAGRLDSVLTSVVVDSPVGKEFRLPTQLETECAARLPNHYFAEFNDIPYGFLTENICSERPSPNTRGASGLPRYGFDTWADIFTHRQLLSL